MEVLTFPFGMLEANAYLAHNGNDAVVVDPPDDPDIVLGVIRHNSLNLRAILLTHLHFDHCSGCGDMSLASGLPVQVGRQDWEMRNIMLAAAMRFNFPEVKEFPVEILEPGPVTWGSLQGQVIHAPGHSRGSLCFYFAEASILFAGDVLFYRSVGRSDFPGGDPDVLRASLTSLYALPPKTVVFPGHGEPTTIGDEARQNPFWRVE